MRPSMTLCVNMSIWMCNRLDIVCLRLALMPDCTVYVVYRLNFPPLFPHFTKSDLTIRQVFWNSVIFFQKIRPICEKSRLFFRPLGTMDLFLAACYAKSVVCCMSLSHTMRVRDKIHYVRYASIQCVRWREKESPRLVMHTTVHVM